MMTNQPNCDRILVAMDFLPNGTATLTQAVWPTRQTGAAYVRGHAVQADGYNFVLAATRGAGKWEEFFVGSTAKRLIRNCPTSVRSVNSHGLA